MRDLETYLSVAPVLSTLWFASLAGFVRISSNRSIATPEELIVSHEKLLHEAVHELLDNGICGRFFYPRAMSFDVLGVFVFVEALIFMLILIVG
ncbi:Photosystem I PsaJ, reaction centre subunit IX [Cynara cardunculus var. scolymus]|uniref:Photosystem I reaction center subunit IX n=1 Tax=Cynara cardunculus var. scolymus TaxID=59895 RepID=A0A103YCX3_CYNCS|nr:Photosystem I PsaJ, reaction centre subunit IX [Cynara cardunculus var. scolymus]